MVNLASSLFLTLSLSHSLTHTLSLFHQLVFEYHVTECYRVRTDGVLPTKLDPSIYPWSSGAPHAGCPVFASSVVLERAVWLPSTLAPFFLLGLLLASQFVSFTSFASLPAPRETLDLDLDFDTCGICITLLILPKATLTFIPYFVLSSFVPRANHAHCSPRSPLTPKKKKSPRRQRAPRK